MTIILTFWSSIYWTTVFLLLFGPYNSYSKEEETGKKRRQVFREDFDPLHGGKVPSGAFDWSRLMFNNLDSRGISIPDGFILSNDRHPPEGVRSQERRIKLYSQDGNELIDSTYTVRNPVQFWMKNFNVEGRQQNQRYNNENQNFKFKPSPPDDSIWQPDQMNNNNPWSSNEEGIEFEDCESNSNGVRHTPPPFKFGSIPRVRKRKRMYPFNNGETLPHQFQNVKEFNSNFEHFKDRNHERPFHGTININNNENSGEENHRYTFHQNFDQNFDDGDDNIRHHPFYVKDNSNNENFEGEYDSDRHPYPYHHKNGNQNSEDENNKNINLKNMKQNFQNNNKGVKFEHSIHNNNNNNIKQNDNNFENGNHGSSPQFYENIKNHKITPTPTNYGQQQYPYKIIPQNIDNSNDDNDETFGNQINKNIKQNHHHNTKRGNHDEHHQFPQNIKQNHHHHHNSIPENSNLNTGGGGDDGVRFISGTKIPKIKLLLENEMEHPPPPIPNETTENDDNDDENKNEGTNNKPFLLINDNEPTMNYYGNNSSSSHNNKPSDNGGESLVGGAGGEQFRDQLIDDIIFRIQTNSTTTPYHHHPQHEFLHSHSPPLPFSPLPPPPPPHSPNSIVKVTMFSQPHRPHQPHSHPQPPSSSSSISSGSSSSGSSSSNTPIIESINIPSSLTYKKRKSKFKSILQKLFEPFRP